MFAHLWGCPFRNCGRTAEWRRRQESGRRLEGGIKDIKCISSEGQKRVLCHKELEN
jgi:hypothetical protein